MSAGCMFTDGTYVICGLQGTEVESLSGFGGKALEGESAIDTAIRETLEELYHLTSIPEEVLRTISIECMPRRYLQNNGYDILVYSFEDLYDWGLILSQYKIQSPLYEIIPLTVSDLLFKRKQVEATEIKCLCLLPLRKSLQIHPLFQEDIDFLVDKIEAPCPC